MSPMESKQMAIWGIKTPHRCRTEVDSPLGEYWPLRHMIVLFVRMRNIEGSNICVQIRYFRLSRVTTQQLERVSCTRSNASKVESWCAKTFGEKKSKGRNPATVTNSWNLIWLKFELKIRNNNKNAKKHKTLLGQYYSERYDVQHTVQIKKKLCEKVFEIS